MSRATLCLAAKHLRLVRGASPGSSRPTTDPLRHVTAGLRASSSRTHHFPACGRPRGEGTAGSTNDRGDAAAMASLPKGEGAEELIAQSCAALGACSRYESSTNPPIIDRTPRTRLHRAPAFLSNAIKPSNIKLTIPTFHLHPSRDTPKLTPDEIQTRLKAVPTWTLDPQGVAISRKFTAKNWKSALDFVNQLSIVAEEEGHHPDVHLTNWRDVEVVASTHAIGGLSLHDFVLAAKLDTIDVTYSPKWLRENAE